MAIALYTSSDEKFAFLEQTTWGTGGGNASALKKGIFTEGFGINRNYNVRTPVRAKAQRYFHTSDMIIDDKGVVYQTDGLSCPFMKDQGDYFVYGVVQNTVESSGTPYQKVFYFGSTQPDFSSSAGIFFTLWDQMPVVSCSPKLHDAIISELTLSCAPGANDGALWSAATFVGRDYSDTSNPSGTITYPDQAATDFFYFHDIGSVDIYGETPVLGDNGFTLTIRNGAKPVGQASGLFQTFALPRYEAELQIQILWDQGAKVLLAAAAAGTELTFAIKWGTTGVDGYLALEGRGIAQPPVLDHNVEGDFVTFNIVCGGISSSTYPVLITMANAVDRSW